MIYTSEFGHLEDIPKYIVGAKIQPGELFAVMGNSGQSDAIHLHFTCAEGMQTAPWTLEAMEHFYPRPAPRQAAWFITDDGLFKTTPHITTAWNCPEYLQQRGKCHQAFDVVPLDRRETKAHYGIHWARSMEGLVTYCGQHNGYGNIILIAFES